MKSKHIATVLMVCGITFMTGCSSVTDPLDGIGDPTSPGAPVPEELAGQWQTILTYVPAYWTGIIPNADMIGSIGVFYYFSPDGRYQLDVNSALTYFNGICFRSTSWTEWGTLGIAGSDLTLKPARATNVITDSCGESVLDDNAPTTASTLSFTYEQDPFGWPMLRLVLPSGEELVLEACRDCQ